MNNLNKWWKKYITQYNNSTTNNKIIINKE